MPHSSANDQLPGSGSPAANVDDAIAIVGMACRFPQEADEPEKFWDMLLHARSALTEFPPHKMNIDAHYHPDPAHGGTVR